VLGTLAAAVIAIGAGIGWLTLGSAAKLPVVVAGASSLPTGIALTPPSTSPVSASAERSASAQATASGTPTAQPVTAASWSKPAMIGAPGQCTSVVATIDGSGTDHVAANCDTNIRYAASAGGTWTVTDFMPPIDRLEKDPQIAVDGNTLYLAYTRMAATQGGCGDDGLRDVGVYYRVRTLPNGAWSDPKPIGPANDHIQTLRVRGTIHATVLNDKDGKTYYETLNGSTYHRYPIAKAAGPVSLRLGSDGRARIAYETAAGSLAYGVFRGSGFTTSVIPGSTGSYAPILVLGKGNAAYVLWNRGYHGFGCAEPGPGPTDGTYFGSNVSGRWVSSRLTTNQGASSLVVDVRTGDVQALVAVGTRLLDYVKQPNVAWRHSTLVNGYEAPAVLRQDPNTGALLVAYVGLGPGGLDGPPAVYVMTRR
jgi:hypothetical protein